MSHKETKEERAFRKLSKNMQHSDKIIMTDNTKENVVQQFMRKEDLTDDEADDYVEPPVASQKPLDDDISDTQNAKNSRKKNDDNMSSYTNRHSDILSKLSNRQRVIKKIVSQPINDNNSALPDAQTSQPVPYERLNELKCEVKSYIDTDDKIRKIEAELKILKEQRKNAQESIIVHLDRMGEEQINIANGILNVKRKATGGALKKETVENVLSGKIGNTKIKDEIINSIDDICNANKKITTSIERKFSK